MNPIDCFILKVSFNSNNYLKKKKVLNIIAQLFEYSEIESEQKMKIMV